MIRDDPELWTGVCQDVAMLMELAGDREWSTGAAARVASVMWSRSVDDADENAKITMLRAWRGLVRDARTR